MNTSITPTVLDGWTYVLIAFFGAWALSFAQDDAAKYMSPFILWLCKSVCGSISASLLALKMFRSTTYADYKKEKNGTNPPFLPEKKV